MEDYLKREVLFAILANLFTITFIIVFIIYSKRESVRNLFMFGAEQKNKRIKLLLIILGLISVASIALFVQFAIKGFAEFQAEHS